MSRAAGSASERFSELLLRYRGRTGLTQRELAARVGASRRVVQDWEAGINVPSADHLQRLIAVLFEAGSLSAGREAAEARALWTSATAESSSRLRRPLDEQWMSEVLGQNASESNPTVPASQLVDARRQDWGEAPDVIGFVGRAGELETCHVWLAHESVRLLVVLGMGGIGKTTLAARVAQDAAPTFQSIYWRSLRDALPASDWLAGAIGFLTDHKFVAPAREPERLTALLQLLRERRSLLVLDNFETVLDSGEYRRDSAGYGRIVQAVGGGRHQSCLLLTRREAPPEVAKLGGGPVRAVELGGLAPAECQLLLAHNQLVGDSDQWATLIARFGGNGLALKVVGERVRQLFGGDIGAFLEQESGSGSVFGDIRRLLSEQIERGSALEQDLLRVLAVEREPVRLSELLAALGSRGGWPSRSGGRGEVLDAVEALRRRSLIERTETDANTAFTLQPVVLDYVTERLVEDVSGEIARSRPSLLVTWPLIRAQAKEYVRQTQGADRGTGHSDAEHTVWGLRNARAAARAVDSLAWSAAGRARPWPRQCGQPPAADTRRRPARHRLLAPVDSAGAAGRS